MISFHADMWFFKKDILLDMVACASNLSLGA